MKRKVPRVAYDLPPEIIMAIKIRAAKDRTNIRDVISAAVRATFTADVEDAKEAIREKGNAGE